MRDKTVKKSLVFIVNKDSLIKSKGPWKKGKKGKEEKKVIKIGENVKGKLGDRYLMDETVSGRHLFETLLLLAKRLGALKIALDMPAEKQEGSELVISKYFKTGEYSFSGEEEGKADLELPGRGQTHDPTADDQEVVTHLSATCQTGMSRGCNTPTRAESRRRTAALEGRAALRTSKPPCSVR